MVSVHGASGGAIVNAIDRGSIDSEDLVSREGWRRICQVRGRNFVHVDEEAWQELCSSRGYLLSRSNPRGLRLEPMLGRSVDRPADPSRYRTTDGSA
jgi:hypothetical protein